MEKLTGKGRRSSAQKYDIKTSNHEKRSVQMQDTGNAFEIKRIFLIYKLYLKLKTLLFIDCHHGNHKLKIYNKYTKKKKESKHSTKVTHQITRGIQKRKRRKGPTKTNPKQLRKWS